MQIILQLRKDAALAAHNRKAKTPDSEELLRLAKDLDVILEPVHPGSLDPHLLPYFKLEAKDRVDAAQLSARFRKLEAVESVYVKPEDKMP